jgi:hypothetical protein
MIRYYKLRNPEGKFICFKVEYHIDDGELEYCYTDSNNNIIHFTEVDLPEEVDVKDLTESLLKGKTFISFYSREIYNMDKTQEEINELRKYQGLITFNSDGTFSLTGDGTDYEEIVEEYSFTTDEYSKNYDNYFTDFYSTSGTWSVDENGLVTLNDDDTIVNQTFEIDLDEYKGYELITKENEESESIFDFYNFMEVEPVNLIDSKDTEYRFAVLKNESGEYTHDFIIDFSARSWEPFINLREYDENIQNSDYISFSVENNGMSLYYDSENDEEPLRKFDIFQTKNSPNNNDALNHFIIYSEDNEIRATRWFRGRIYRNNK